jgi:hypothetical protein
LSQNCACCWAETKNAAHQARRFVLMLVSPLFCEIDDIFGSTAKAGVIDTAMGLYRERNEETAVLKITGRDLSDCELALRWDAARFRWECQGEAKGVAGSARQQEVIDALKTLGKAQLRDLADATGQSRTNCFDRLQSLLKHKLVVRTEEAGQVFYSAV